MNLPTKQDILEQITRDYLEEYEYEYELTNAPELIPAGLLETIDQQADSDLVEYVIDILNENFEFDDQGSEIVNYLKSLDITQPSNLVTIILNVPAAVNEEVIHYFLECNPDQSLKDMLANSEALKDHKDLRVLLKLACDTTTNIISPEVIKTVVGELLSNIIGVDSYIQLLDTLPSTIAPFELLTQKLHTQYQNDSWKVEITDNSAIFICDLIIPNVEDLNITLEQFKHTFPENTSVYIPSRNQTPVDKTNTAIMYTADLDSAIQVMETPELFSELLKLCENESILLLPVDLRNIYIMFEHPEIIFKAFVFTNDILSILQEIDIAVKNLIEVQVR